MTAMPVVAPATTFVPVPPDMWARLSWHARQQMETRARRAAREVDWERAHVSRKRVRVPVNESVETVTERAEALLAELPADPHASQHRAVLYREITRRENAR